MKHKHAVVIAGDGRMFEQAAHTYAHMLEGADVFVSMWKTSTYRHKSKPTFRFTNGPFTFESIERCLNRIPSDLVIEEYNDREWGIHRGYNANYLHRLRAGVDMVRKHGPYDTVFFMRPDLWLHSVGDLDKAARSVTKGSFITIWSDAYSVHKTHKLQDLLFGVHYDDMDRAVPTVSHYEPRRLTDWHTYFCKFVLDNELQIVNIADAHLVILRPWIDDPTVPIDSWEKALQSNELWTHLNVIKMIDTSGLQHALKMWGPSPVLRAVQYAVDKEIKNRGQQNP
jgi:hypothetical protein